jgi:FMN-dependent NADH-azoreductase
VQEVFTGIVGVRSHSLRLSHIKGDALSLSKGFRNYWCPNRLGDCYTPPEQQTPEMWEAICFSDRLVDEFLAADIYIIGVPMYNFSIPSTFKAYIDQIVRLGRTFAFEPENSANPYQPLVLEKKMFVIAARGGSGFGRGGQYETLNCSFKLQVK